MNIYAIPGMPDLVDGFIDEMFDPVFITTPEEKTDYLMQKVKQINGVRDICPKTRKLETKECRHWHIFLMRRINRMSQSSAGSVYGKDHATALNAERRILEWVQGDKPFQKKYREVIDECIEFETERIFE